MQTQLTNELSAYSDGCGIIWASCYGIVTWSLPSTHHPPKTKAPLKKTHSNLKTMLRFDTSSSQNNSTPKKKHRVT